MQVISGKGKKRGKVKNPTRVNTVKRVYTLKESQRDSIRTENLKEGKEQRSI